MCLSSVILAVLLLLDFEPSTIPGKDCSWGASADFRPLGSGSDRRFIRLGDVNIGASLSLTEQSSQLRYTGIEQLSQV